MDTKLLLVLVVLVISVECFGHVIHLAGNQNNCTQTERSLLKSLENVAIDLQNSTEIWFCSEHTELRNLVHFEKKSNISFLGYSTIQCIESNAGFKFSNIENLLIKNLEITGCGAVHQSTTTDTTTYNSTLSLLASIYIINCTNVEIVNVTVSDSNGSGVVFFDTDGIVEVINSKFMNNSVHINESDMYPGGGGVYVEFTYCTPGLFGECDQSKQKNSNSRYSFHQCMFENNNASTLYQNKTSFVRAKGNIHQGTGRGGGLCIIFKGRASNIAITITHCSFTNNFAIWGGGLYSEYQDTSNSNTLFVKHSEFVENESYLSGGGIIVGYIFFSGDNKISIPTCNKITFKNCTFIYNKARSGGGALLYSSRSPNNSKHMNNEMEFIMCTWERNLAEYGSAVDITTQVFATLANGFLPIPVFESCDFIENKIDIKVEEHEMPSYKVSKMGKGTFFAAGFRIYLRGELSFKDNIGSALYMSDSYVEIENNSKVFFQNNSAPEGGAIVLIGFSAIVLHENIGLNFCGNKAKDKGGAIYYYSTNEHDYIHSQSCFIHYYNISDTNSHERGINFLFTNNVAGSSEYAGHGHSIYATTLDPCYKNCAQMMELSSYKETFSCIGNFTFENTERKSDIATIGGNINVTDKNLVLIEAIPGKAVKLPIEFTDELGNTVEDVYLVSVNNSDITIANPIIYNNIIQLLGTPDDVAELKFSTIKLHEVSLFLTARLQHCPPGYVHEDQKCTCSASINGKRLHGINSCDDVNFRAVLKRGYWIGYNKNNELQKSGSADQLISGICPTMFCSESLNKNNGTLLPNDSDINHLDQFMCGDHRTGILCTKCRENNSVYFHSYGFRCHTNEKCNLGWLLYIITQLVPVTCLFILIILLDIKLTSGSLNGIIFYAQVIDTMHITAKGFIQFPPIARKFLDIYHLLYRMFNLDFFKFDALSFCLWKGATTLDILAFKYVTVLYSLILVLVTIILMKMCNLRRFYHYMKVFSGRNMKFNLFNTAIHGISSFLILCYSHSTHVTLLLLTPTVLYTSGIDRTEHKHVVLHDGNLRYLHGNHLYYAIPAFFFLLTIVLLPPMMLISYPLCYKIFKCLRISESKFTRIICMFIPLEKFRPFFDSFQSSFKDEYRYIAGLYFVYRLSMLVILSLTERLNTFYTILEIQLILMLVVHSYLQPYKEQWHNRLDTLLFANLAIINGMTFYSFSLTIDILNNYEHVVNAICYLQTILVYLPLGYILLYLAAKLASQIKHCYKKNIGNSSNYNQLELSFSTMENRGNDEDPFDGASRYQQLKED